MNTNTQATLEQLQELKLYGMAKRYEAVMQLHSHEQPDAHVLTAQLTEAERSYRTHRRTELYLRLSKLRYNAVPEQINCSAERGITKEQLSMFCDGTFIDKNETFLSVAPPVAESLTLLVLLESKPVCWAIGLSISL